MSNTSKGWGRKGSKFWMQMVACFPTLEKEFIKEVEKAEYGKETNTTKLTWISPCIDKDLEEYTLNSPTMKEVLGFKEEFWNTWKGTNLPFWPARQPQWDGIAFCAETKTLYLIEAKAHLSETNTSISINNEENPSESYNIRVNSLRYARKSFWKGSDVPSKETLWWGGSLVKKESNQKEFYYQIGNRLAFLRFLNEKKDELGVEIRDVKLIFLNFADDYTLGKDKYGHDLSATICNWEEHYEKIWKAVTGRDSAPDNVFVINYNVGTILGSSRIEKEEHLVKKENKAGSKRLYRWEDANPAHWFKYRNGSKEVLFDFLYEDKKMRCCKRGTNIPIKEIETILGVN